MANNFYHILPVAIIWLFANAVTASPEGKAVKEVCYGDLGCFTNEKPWSAFGRICYLPDSPEKIATKFIVYNRKHPEGGPYPMLAGYKEILQVSGYDTSKPVKFIVHGFLDTGSKPWLKKMAQTLLAKYDINVVIVDWGNGSQGMYGHPAANIRVVAAQTVQMIQFLSNVTGLKNEDVHIIGHDLGAHLAGLVGNALKDLGRITGLDPTGPYFQKMDPLIRLDETDAKFVDVIHTDGSNIASSLLLQGGFGTWQPSGHVDVYVNGGKKQPGCLDSLIESIPVEGLGSGTLGFVSCYHTRALELGIDTIAASCPYRSYLCEDWDEFQTGRCLRCPTDGANNNWCNSVGFKALKPEDNSVNRMYWMATGGKAPYCANHYHVQFTLKQNSNKEQKGKVWFRLVGNHESSDLYIVNDGKHFSLKAGATLDFLVTSTKDLGDSIHRVELQWEHDPSWFDISDWLVENPVHQLYPEKVTVFSGERQNQFTFCDLVTDPLDSKQLRVLSINC